MEHVYPETTPDDRTWMVEESANPPVVTFRDLIVWQKSMDLVVETYSATKLFPQSEQFGLISQMRRSAVSIPSNIAEGFGRRATGEYKRFLHIAAGSLYELQTQCELSLRLGIMAHASYSEFMERSREIERMLSSLVRKLT